MSKHARLSPSNHRWVYCAGSVRMEENYPDISGAAAIDGTGSHLLLEMCLLNNVSADQYDGQIIGVNHEDNPMGWMVSTDRIERVQQCLDYVLRRYHELTDTFQDCVVTVEAESKSDVGESVGRDDWHGTCDITITALTQSGVILFVEVVDYKDGRGWVSEKDNTQLLAYLGGKIHLNMNPSNLPCRMTIVQPRRDPSVRYQDTVKSHVMGKIQWLADCAAATDAVDAPLKAGHHCLWCKHKPNCSQQTEQSIERIKPMTNNIQTSSGSSLFESIEQTFGDITTLTSDKLAELADARAGIEAAFDKVEAEIQTRIESGQTVDGYAMVHGRGRREWNADEEAIVKVLKARRLKLKDIYPPKLISPAQALKLSTLTDEQKSKLEKQYITMTEGALKLGKVERTVADAAELFKGVDIVTPSFL